MQALLMQRRERSASCVRHNFMLLNVECWEGSKAKAVHVFQKMLQLSNPLYVVVQK